MWGITEKVLVGTTLLGAVSGLIGSFAVLQRRALIGDMLSHAALPGICLAFLLGAIIEPILLKQFNVDAELRRNLLVLLGGALMSGLLGIGVVSVVCRWTRTKEDAAIGIVLSTFFGAGIVLLSAVQNMPVSRKAGLDAFLFGQASGMRNQDILVIIAVSLVSLIVVALLYKEFKLFSFDAEFARSQGWPTLLLDLAMMGTLTLVTIVGLPAVGVVLMAALIIIPGAAARFWTDRLGRMLVLSAAFGAAAGMFGTLSSSGLMMRWVGFDPFKLISGGPLPTGPVIVLCGTAIFLFSVLFAPQRGVLARVWANWVLRRKTAREHLLRTLYELSESALPERTLVPVADVIAHRSWQRGSVARLLVNAQRAGLVDQHSDDTIRLTPAGLQCAAQITRRHRLWELFLIEGAGIAADHVDRDADNIEHFLSATILHQLEAQLAASGRLPSSLDAVPVSPHQVTGPVAEGVDG